MRFTRGQKGLTFRQKKKRIDGTKLRKILVWAAQIAAVVAISYFVVFSFGFRTMMIGNAMQGTLEAQDQVLVNRFVLMVSSPKRMDVVVFLPKSNARSNYYIRRVVGVPGDTVRITDGYLYVNDEVTDLPGSGEEITVPGLAADEITLGEDEYFVMGDNPNASEDSRHFAIGTVSREDMVGVAYMVISPIDHLGTID